MPLLWAAFIGIPGAALAAGNYPHAEISNGAITVSLNLPSAEGGSYQGTRFDWFGIITSLRYKNHEYFGQWYPTHDPKIHDAITGPVEEFLTDGAGPGYKEAKPGESFVRIGVGAVRKIEEPEYRRFATYDIVDHGEWTVRTEPDSIAFTQKLTLPSGWGYEYRKTVRTGADHQPELILEHSLRNTGKHAIDTQVYDHNFFVIDGETVGPEVAVYFGFQPQTKSDFKGPGKIDGDAMVFLRELAPKESVSGDIAGFGPDSSSNNFRIENHKSGAGVRIVGDKPLAKVYFWAIRTVACPEPYISLHVEPGEETHWAIRYRFYELSER